MSAVECEQRGIFTSLPAYEGEYKDGQLTDEQIRIFLEQGYLVVEDFFNSADLEPCKRAIEGLVDKLAEKLFAAGKITDKHSDKGLFQRLTHLEEDWPGATIILFKSGAWVQEFGTLWSNNKLLNLMEQIVGPDVAGHPVWNLRPKTPNNAAVDIPWHQDSGYFCPKSYDHMIPTAWIPFLDTCEENGGMQMVKYAHKHGKVAKHTCCAGPTWYIMLDEEEMENSLGVNCEEDVESVKVPYGGLLLFHNITPHRSHVNRSDKIRWSVDLRWQSPHYDWGFYDIVEGIMFREKGVNVEDVDWKRFLSVNRKEVWQQKYCNKDKEETCDDVDEFDTTITGPWIGRWETVNHNQHTEAFEKMTS